VKEINNLEGCWAKKRTGGINNRGEADITGSVWGRRLEIEVKVGDNKPTELQKKWIEHCKAMGMIAGVVWSVEEALSLVSAHYEAEQQIALSRRAA
jgi:hypothetical protein